jgi:nucleotide-binding universal stress UspA family protein
MFSRILAVVDGSEQGARALAVATELAVADQVRLTLMAIVPRPSPLAWGCPLSPAELRSEAERYYEAILRNAAEAVPQEVPTILLLRHGGAADRLLDEVGRDHYDLIVVGSRERGRLCAASSAASGRSSSAKAPYPSWPYPCRRPMWGAPSAGDQNSASCPSTVSIVTAAPPHDTCVCQPTCPRVTVELRRRRASRCTPRRAQSPQPTPAGLSHGFAACKRRGSEPLRLLPTTRDRAR